MLYSLEFLTTIYNTHMYLYTHQKDNKEHKIEIKSLKESLNQLAKEGNSNHQELSTVLKAEIKTRYGFLLYYYGFFFSQVRMI